MDRLTPDRRSWLMSRVKSRDTGPELTVRQVAHALGFRFRLHRRDLPGTPDLVFPKRRAVVFVHGCFWHRHEGCAKTTTPKSRAKFWQEKFDRNVQRDQRALRDLNKLGWRTLVVWQCETNDRAALGTRLERFLGSGDET